MIQGRYYIQPLTAQIFLIRERTSPNGDRGPNDRLVRSFNIRHDAEMFVDSMNSTSKNLSENADHQTQQTS